VINNTNLPVLPTTINEEESSTSLSPRDTADVSTQQLKLLPKPISNPYSKKEKKTTLDQNTHRVPTTQNDKQITNESNTSSLSSNQTKQNHNSTNELPTATMTPHLTDPTSRSKSSQKPSTTAQSCERINNNETSTNTTILNTEFEELSQDDLQLVNRAIAEHAETNNWIEVPTKPSKGTYTPVRTKTKADSNNQYSALQSDDDDTKNSTEDMEVQKLNHQPVSTTVITNLQNTNKENPGQTRITSPPRHKSQTQSNKKSSSGHQITAGRGGGKIQRDSQSNLTKSLVAVATAPADNATSTDEPEDMELDEPKTPRKQPPNSDGTQRKPPPNTDGTQRKPPPNTDGK
jgi:putative lipoic acid-binding regulatory protein